MSGTSSDRNQNRVDVLGVSVDQSTTWTTSPPASANVLGAAFTGNNRITTRALNFLSTATTNASNATDGFATRFTTVIGNEIVGADQSAFAAIGKNLIQAVHGLISGGGGPGPGGDFLPLTGGTVSPGPIIIKRDSGGVGTLALSDGTNTVGMFNNGTGLALGQTSSVGNPSSMWLTANDSLCEIATNLTVRGDTVELARAGQVNTGDLTVGRGGMFGEANLLILGGFAGRSKLSFNGNADVLAASSLNLVCPTLTLAAGPGLPTTVDLTGWLKVSEWLQVSGGVGFFGASAPTSRPTITGSRSDGTALASLIDALVANGMVADATTA